MANLFLRMGKKCIDTALKKINYTTCPIMMALDKERQQFVFKHEYIRETAEGVNDTFAFVSIDVDLYEPMYKGLHFFYERLNSGGYIMLHDYNNTEYKGIKAAMRKFSEERKAPYFPLCDSYGSAIIMKA